MDRSFRARLRYRSDEFLSGGAGRQLFALFVMTLALVVLFTIISFAFREAGQEVADEGLINQAWFYFTRFLDAGTMGGDAGNLNRVVSTLATIAGVVVAGLLISSLAGNFQDRLEAIKSEGSPVIEQNHFLILGWSEKVPAIIDQLSEANIERGNIVAVVMAEHPKMDMEAALRDKIQHPERVKVVVRNGSSVVLTDLSKVAFELCRAIVVLVDDATAADPNRADGRVIKTLMALYNHPDGRGRINGIRVTAEVMLSENAEIAAIASNRAAQIITTNDIISRIILQTARISGLSLVYDELLRFEGNEIHYAAFPQLVGRRFADVLLDFKNGCAVGVAKADGSGHLLNPPADHVIQPDEGLLILAEDDHIQIEPYRGPLSQTSVTIPSTVAQKPVESMLVLGWNEKIFPILQEFDTYVGAGSRVTLVNVLSEEERAAELAQKIKPLQNLQLTHVVGDFTNRQVLEQIDPPRFPTVMVLGDAAFGGGDAEAADTRAIIALLLLRDFRLRAGVASQEVCSEILDPRNRDLAATTQIHDIVISNEMVSMVLAQVTHEPRVRPVLEDLFSSDGSEIYLKDLSFYVQPGQVTTFEQLILAAKARGEVAFGVQIEVEDPRQRYGIMLNPKDRHAPIQPKPGDRLIVLAEDDG
jgi:ion channel POLLUX/CASTOR